MIGYLRLAQCGPGKARMEYMHMCKVKLCMYMHMYVSGESVLYGRD